MTLDTTDGTMLPSSPMLTTLDDETRALVRLAAVLTAGSEAVMRDALSAASSTVRHVWIEELILQTYLFAGFPRALNSAREWRRISGDAAPAHDEGDTYDAAAWEARGLATCSAVYGTLYERLRPNIRALHPSLDTWMIVEGYGKVLGRPQLDLGRRELCIIAACAAAAQDRQLHSHLIGALNVGVTASVISAALESLESLEALGAMVPAQDFARYQALWARVQGK